MIFGLNVKDVKAHSMKKFCVLQETVQYFMAELKPRRTLKNLPVRWTSSMSGD